MSIVLLTEVLSTAFSGFEQVAPIKKEITWPARSVRYASGTSQRGQLTSRPIRKWHINWELMDKAGRDTLIEIFNRVRGSVDVFLWEDSDDYQCLATECIIVAIAAQTEFQLIKTYYPSESDSFTENKTRIQPGSIYAPIVKVDNVTKTEGVDFTLDDNTGVLTFSVAPGVGAVVTADYRFYFPACFADVTLVDTQVGPELYSNPNLQIVEVIE